MSSKQRGLTGILLVISMLSMIWLCCSRSERAKLTVKYELEVKHDPIKQHIGEGAPIAIVAIESSRDLAPDAVKLVFNVGDSGESLPMTLVKKNVYQIELPRYEKGTQVNYFIEVMAPDGSTVVLPEKALEGQRFQFIFKGSLAKGLRVLHITLSLMVLLFFVLAFLLALSYIRKHGSLIKCLYVSLIAAILFFIVVVPVGMVIHQIVFGTVYQGWPFGREIADTAIILLVIFWILAIVGMRGALRGSLETRTWFNEKVFAYLVIVGSTLSFVFYVVSLL